MSAPGLPRFQRVVDLRSGTVVGWELRAVGEPAPAGMLGIALEARTKLPAGRFIAVRLPARAVAPQVLDGAERLDGLALLAVGDTTGDAVPVLEEARERGALIGCDGAASVLELVELQPDVLLVPERLLTSEANGSAERLLETLARTARQTGAKALLDGVATVEDARELRDLGIRLGQGAAFGADERPGQEPAVVTALADDAVERSIEELAEAVPSVTRAHPLGVILEHCLSDDDRDWLIVVDDEVRPVGLVERAALLRGEPFEHRVFTVTPSMSFRAVARVAALRPPRDRLRPLACCDAHGRYEGLVRVERLLEALVA
jgi:hypothetical protein